MIGLVGANGVGKTTLAREFAIEQKIGFLETSTTAMLTAVGIDPAADYDLGTRYAAQVVVLTAMTRQYEAMSRKARVWITDRTPLDLAAYMLADVTRTNCDDPEMIQCVMDYVQNCFDVANRFFGLLVLLQPGIEVPLVREGKANSSPAFQEHFNALAFGLLMDERLRQQHFYIKRHCLALADRKASLFNAMTTSSAAHKQLMQSTMNVAH
jgi:hypothetical protein